MKVSITTIGFTDLKATCGNVSCPSNANIIADIWAVLNTTNTSAKADNSLLKNISTCTSGGGSCDVMGALNTAYTTP